VCVGVPGVSARLEEKVIGLLGSEDQSEWIWGSVLGYGSSVELSYKRRI
jgi:hypothetical protein